MKYTYKIYIWRIVEVVGLSIATLFLVTTVSGVPSNVRPLIYVATIIFILYLEYMCRRLWPRIMLPLSYFSLGLLISRMIVGAVPWNYYLYIVLVYLVTSFTLYHAIYRIIAVFLGDRRNFFKSILEDINLDIVIYLIVFTGLAICLYMFRTIQWWALVVVVLGSWIIWFFTKYYLSTRVHRMLLTGQAARWGFAHPVEPEAEKTLLSTASLVVLVSLMIPLLFSYTSPILVRRGFIPLMILGVFEAITCLLYLIAYILVVHGAFIEELCRIGDRLVYVENYRVFRGWRDISWFLNRSAGYYYRLKYLSALYMLFQGLEIFSRRTGDKELYYGELYDLLNTGYNYIISRKLDKYIDIKSIKETMEYFKPDNIWVVEADTKAIENEPEEIKEVYRRIFSSIVNLYAKLKDLPSEAYRDKDKLIDTVIQRLVQFRNTRIRDSRERERIDRIIGILKELRSRSDIEQKDLENGLLIRKPVTINIIRAYLVHGQLVKNAILYRGSRDKFDKLMSKPSVLYSLYTLIIAYLVDKHPELIHGIRGST